MKIINSDVTPSSVRFESREIFYQRDGLFWLVQVAGASS
jgi:hypothetical protein